MYHPLARFNPNCVIKMDKFKQEPQSLVVSDLQLLVAFAMRNGVDLTNYMSDEGEHFAISYTPKEGGLFIDEGITLRAHFTKDGRTKFIKYEIANPY